MATREGQPDDKDANAQLQLREERMKRFLAAASHDLQSPLRHIAMHADILCDDLADRLEADHLASLQMIMERAKHLQDMTKALMSFAAGTPQVAIAPVDLKALLITVARDLEEQITAANVSLTHRALPVINTDPQLLGKVLRNLLINSIEHAATAAPCIDVSASTEKDHFLILVKDNGPGIDARYQQHIFEPFWKLPRNGATPGAGLGLTIARELMEAMRGTLTLAQSDASGTTFAIGMPAVIR